MQVAEGDSGALDLHVYSLPDSGHRGRPRVAADVADVLLRCGLRVERAFVGLVDVADVPACVPAPHVPRLAATLSFPVLEVPPFHPCCTPLSHAPS